MGTCWVPPNTALRVLATVLASFSSWEGSKVVPNGFRLDVKQREACRRYLAKKALGLFGALDGSSGWLEPQSMIISEDKMHIFGLLSVQFSAMLPVMFPLLILLASLHVPRLVGWATFRICVIRLVATAASILSCAARGIGRIIKTANLCPKSVLTIVSESRGDCKIGHGELQLLGNLNGGPEKERSSVDTENLNLGDTATFTEDQIKRDVSADQEDP
ncbi:hypothetical protein BV898_19728 [Hypsibius exemplaris]|uniref:Uncharacterized protein n=1 Tax=Hypsibius exemplaris TaxID=2072580 RepID=A0A9X6NSP4_HYPEX|nr:hypothetical protein BV898_19728 [Hypsibius exemplaris]